MPHVVYLAASIVCPWPGCNYLIELIDFQLEKMGDPAFYARVMLDWGQHPDYGLIGRCPGCKQYVRFGASDKQPVNDPTTIVLPLLPDDWHLHAHIE
jgi:hypothetical protein